MSPFGEKNPADRERGETLRRSFKRYAPPVIWGLAVIAAITMYPRRLSPGAFLGYAEDRSIVMTNIEPGMVRELGAGLHEFVEPGDVLVRMDDRGERLELVTLTTDLERLRKEVDAERSKLELDVANIEFNEIDLSRRLLTDRESAHIQYLSALVTQASDQSLLNGLLVELDILNRLFEKEQASFRELNNFETQVETVRTRIETNKENIARMLQVFQDADRRWFTYSDRQELPIDYESVLTPIRLAADVREREIAELTYRMDQCILRSPIHGQVTALFVQSGDRVMSGDPLLVISPVRTDRVVAYLPENQAALASLGSSVRLYPVSSGPDGPRKIEGTVQSISDAIRETPLRHRKVPNWPVWGREVIISTGNETLLPGEAVSLVLAH